MCYKDIEKNGMKIKSFFKNCIGLLLLLILTTHVNAQNNPKLTIEQYIEIYKNIAIAHMKEFRIPSSIILAQAILESSWGNSDLAVAANNHFGIKCHEDWTGKTYIKDDDTKDECFRKYNDPIESFKDHALFLTTRSRYACLFDLEITDYKGWSNGLKQAGYATNPKYPELLINLIEKYALFQYDKAQPFIADNGKKQKPGREAAQGKPVASKSSGKHEISLNNRVKYIIARKDDSFLSLATALNMGTWQFYRYNDMDKKDHIEEGQKIYLQPKRRKSSAYKQHIVKEGETLFDISQQYAVKIKHLHRLNPEMNPDGDISSGQIIQLQKKAIIN